MSLPVSVNLKRLYKALCPKCRETLLDLAEIAPNKEQLRKALEGKS